MRSERCGPSILRADRVLRRRKRLDLMRSTHGERVICRGTGPSRIGAFLVGYLQGTAHYVLDNYRSLTSSTYLCDRCFLCANCLIVAYGPMQASDWVRASHVRWNLGQGPFETQWTLCIWTVDNWSSPVDREFYGTTFVPKVCACEQAWTLHEWCCSTVP